ncbi:rhomboid family intramembrane serine protease [Opitutus sp. ER46]|uniref:rhomboid family intramembrane serine protease n=1 Tax=Opitutus sp. ER46 TaxID=2161864 RepID=UPI000D31A755|nr:rhomboid family intramembrane serine protease [Opitutus sp. ER46]PTX91481.1 hypothetical protein DB354_16460 [Opitutus sp. ER46]
MSLLDRLERIFGRFAVPNLALYLVIGQVFVFVSRMFGLLPVEKLMYAPVLVLQGEWWRPLTFMFVIPLPQGLFGYVFTAFGWYLFYMMSSAMESYWGVFRFNLFLFTNWLLTAALAFVTPYTPVTNLYILGAVFLAYAFINPDFELLLFFVLPLKIKWIALFTWALYGVNFFLGSWGLRLQIAAAAITFLLFFGSTMLRGARQSQRQSAARTERAREQVQPRHVCYVCGKTDLSHPDLDFRYCSKCAGDQCYCPEHIHNHAHVVASEDQAGH